MYGTLGLVVSPAKAEPICTKVGGGEYNTKKTHSNSEARVCFASRRPAERANHPDPHRRFSRAFGSKASPPPDFLSGLAYPALL